MVLLHLYLVLHLCVKPGADPEGRAPPLLRDMYMAHPYFTNDCSITTLPVMLRKTAQKLEKKFAGNGECKVAIPND